MITYSGDSRNADLMKDANKGEKFLLVSAHPSFPRKPISKICSPWLYKVPDSGFYNQSDLGGVGDKKRWRET